MEETQNDNKLMRIIAILFLVVFCLFMFLKFLFD
jgi:hypothetical protein